jgi:hypothetical protein
MVGALPVTPKDHMRTIRWVLVLTLLMPALGGAAADSGYLYGLNWAGSVSVNANRINALPGNFDPNFPLLRRQEAWLDLAIAQGDQYALRGDGLVVSNGVKLWGLPFTTNAWLWTQLQVDGGTIYQLRQDGKLAVNKDVAATLPVESFYFTSLEASGGATYSLRSDGNVYKNGGATALFAFRAGTGLGGGGDGAEDDTLWYTLKRNPSGQYLYALRTDGVLRRAQLPAGAQAGELVDSFPFPNQAYTTSDLYVDFEFDDVTGAWVVLRADGKVYREPNALTEADDFPGGGPGSGVFYWDLAVYDGRYYALRSDGRVYVEGGASELLKLPGTGYGRIELSGVPPNLAGQKNNAPSVVQYTIPINTDTPVNVPVIATDVETPTNELIVTPVDTPAGSAWDAGALAFTWTTPTNKGNHVFSYIVDDGSGSAKTYKSKIQVKLPDADPAKNKPPYVPKIKGAAALVGQTYRVHVPLHDPDGDPVTATVNTNAYPFNAGAQYDPVMSEFTWTPASTDLGKQTAVFTLSDGTTTKTLKLKVEVKSPLFVAPLPEVSGVP